MHRHEKPRRGPVRQPDTFDINDEDLGEAFPERPLDPLPLAASALVQAALDVRPDIRDDLRTPGAIVVAVVELAWMEHVGKAVYRELFDRDPPVHDRWTNKSVRHDAVPLIECRAADAKTLLSDKDDRVGLALLEGIGAIILTDDVKALPPSIRLAVDHTVVVPSFSARVLLDVAIKVGTGEQPELIADVTGMEPQYLRLASRPKQSAAEFVGRVARIMVAECESKPVVTASGPRWTLENLHGADAAVAWGRTLVSDLAAYQRGDLPWADVDRGALLSGPPGCGKTTFAKALAASCGDSIAFLPTSFSQWDSGSAKGYLSDCQRAMRSIFAEAKRQAPCILFIDELDSIPTRGLSTHNDSYWAPIVNCMLECLDGVSDREGVVVVGATNHAEAIDPAIRRAGRLDREIRMIPPGPEALGLILREHLGGADMNYVTVTKRIPAASGADCERLARGARRRARAAGRSVELGDLLAELAPASRPSAADRRRIAVHEAGHAVVCVLDRPGALGGVSIVAGVDAGGLAWGYQASPLVQGLSDLEFAMRRQLAGRAAEVLVLGTASAWAGGSADSDLAQATAVAANIEASYGLGGSLVYRGEATGSNIDSILALNRDLLEPVELWLKAAEHAATELLRRHRKALDAVVEAMLDADALTGVEVEFLVAGYPPEDEIRVSEMPSVLSAPTRKGCVR